MIFNLFIFKIIFLEKVYINQNELNIDLAVYILNINMYFIIE